MKASSTACKLQPISLGVNNSATFRYLFCTFKVDQILTRWTSWRISRIRQVIQVPSAPCGFGERQRFQKSKPHPPELAVGTNASTTFVEKPAGFVFVLGTKSAHAGGWC